LFAPDLAVSLADRERIPGAARREGFKTCVGQQAGAADVPRVGNNECSFASMKFGESGGGFSLG
jgi:hypothetical protein